MARIVLVHGAFGAASNWNPVLSGLREGRPFGVRARPANGVETH